VKLSQAWATERAWLDATAVVSLCIRMIFEKPLAFFAGKFRTAHYDQQLRTSDKLRITG
jgi:hypothetical protein